MELEFHGGLGLPTHVNCVKISHFGIAFFLYFFGIFNYFEVYRLSQAIRVPILAYYDLLGLSTKIYPTPINTQQTEHILCRMRHAHRLSYGIQDLFNVWAKLRNRPLINLDSSIVWPGYEGAKTARPQGRLG